MKIFKEILVLLSVVFSLAVISPAAGAEYITAYTTGKVTAYTAGKTITVLDHEGKEHTYRVTENSKLPEGLRKGIVVEVKASGIWAASVEIFSE